MRGIFAFLLLLFSHAAHADALERFQSYLRTTQSARGDFAQQVFDKTGHTTQESRGTFAFLRPGRFRWEYLKPHPQVIVGDGQKVWIYDVDLKQVTVRKMARALGSTPAALLAGSSDIERAFELKEVGQRQGLDWLEAVPRERESSFERIRLGFGTAGVEAMELVDHFGQTTVLRFSDVQRNPQLDPDTFRFTPPKGADVLGE